MILGFDNPPILETQRLRLQPLAQEDAELLFPIMSDPEVMAHWDVPEIEDPALVAAIVESQVAAMREGRAIYWAIRTLDDDAFKGCCDLSEIDRWHRRAEVGFMLERGSWGYGYALEAMQSVVAYAAVSGLRRLAARTHLGNRRSEALLERLGFRGEGLLRGHVLRDGERRDCRLFGLLL
ncbi:GNAT family N-acetyltransferase [Phenylobacterium sp.]|uniref:GNAT family N-acetyltransferase n=1 Tax=Phenylobacterium sp. TaxID=1871053 RepID=UPI0035AED74E